MVICSSGWGLAPWILIGLSTEKEWSGESCLSDTGLRVCRHHLGDSGRSTGPRGVHQMLCNLRTHVLHHGHRQTYGRDWCVYMCSCSKCRLVQDTWCVLCTLGKGQRYFVDASLCILPPMWNKGLLRWDLPHPPLLPWPSLPDWFSPSWPLV